MKIDIFEVRYEDEWDGTEGDCAAVLLFAEQEIARWPISYSAFRQKDPDVVVDAMRTLFAMVTPGGAE